MSSSEHSLWGGYSSPASHLKDQIYLQGEILEGRKRRLKKKKGGYCCCRRKERERKMEEVVSLGRKRVRERERGSLDGSFNFVGDFFFWLSGTVRFMYLC